MSRLQHKRILVTGGAGFLGSHIVERLKEEQVRNIYVPRSSQYNLVQMDHVQRLYDDARPDIVIHLAAKVGGIRANMRNPGTFFYENLMMGLQMMEVGRQRGIEKFVALGTACSYPKCTSVPFREEDFWVGYPEETNAPYGLAKRMLLVQSQAYRAQYGLNAIFLIPANLYGPRDNFDEDHSHVIPALIRKCMQARKRGEDHIMLWGTGEPSREFLFVEDAAKAIVYATKWYDGADPINLGTGQETRIREVLAIIQQLTNFSGTVIWNSAMPDGQSRRCLNLNRMKALLGDFPMVDIELGLEQTVQWYQSVLGEDLDRLAGEVRAG